MNKLFEPVAKAMDKAILVAWDGCHKIYLAMDEQQADWFRDSGFAIVEDTPEVMLESVTEWYDVSCGLRFVQSIETNTEDPNMGFVNLIPQFAEAAS